MKKFQILFDNEYYNRSQNFAKKTAEIPQPPCAYELCACSYVLFMLQNTITA